MFSKHLGPSVTTSSFQPPPQQSPFDELRTHLELELPNIVRARDTSKTTKDEIRHAIECINLPAETSLVVFGSLARDEWTSGSDVDWTLLIDGPADPQHFRMVTKISKELAGGSFKKPGASGRFGAMASSHELVHHIGGDSDSNPNMTRRMLLLLESDTVEGEVVRNRVIRAVLDRYIVCGSGLSEDTASAYRCPRFLLNDVVRLWRTFAVDYAAKKWQQSDDKWALRNAKLRIPRKLTFVKGLLLCLDCELFGDKSPWRIDDAGSGSSDDILLGLINGCYTLLQLTPLDSLARACTLLKCNDLAKQLFQAYDEYLCLIDDNKKREHLETKVDFETAKDDSVFQEVRAISHQFTESLERLFFDCTESLTRLTRKYGVF